MLFLRHSVGSVLNPKKQREPVALSSTGGKKNKPSNLAE